MRPTGAAARPSSRPSFCDLWCGRDTLDLIEPPVMLDSAIRNELRGKEFPIRILIVSPAFADDPAVQFQYGSLFLFIIPVQDPARKSAIDDEMGRFGMPAGISGSDRVACDRPTRTNFSRPARSTTDSRSSTKRSKEISITSRCDRAVRFPLRKLNPSANESGSIGQSKPTKRCVNVVGSDRRGKPHEAARVHHTSRRRGRRRCR
jgi:hypothetical protein